MAQPAIIHANQAHRAKQVHWPNERNETNETKWKQQQKQMTQIQVPTKYFTSHRPLDSHEKM